MDRAAAEDWIRAHVEPVGAIETAHERPWATVLRVPLAEASRGSRRARHHANVYAHRERLRVLDWGDASISHPFASLVETFRFLEEINKLPPDDPWFARLRDAERSAGAV